MRPIMNIGMLALMGALAAPAASGVQAGASGPLADLVCKGKPVTIRFGTIKPGQGALFRKAVADHQAWYAARGNGTTVAIIRVTTRTGNTLAYDDNDAMTVVTYDAKPQPPHDAAYDAFVKEYRDSEDVKEEHRGCLGG